MVPLQPGCVKTVSRKSNRLFAGFWKKESKFTADRNCFWSEAGSPPDFLGKTFTQWQAEGRDQHSVVADPGFVNPRESDFSLRPNSPALAVGFQPIDLSTAGLYGHPAWTQLPRGLPHRPCENPVAMDPAATPLAEDFEDYAVGSRPDEARLFEGGDDAAIRVSDDCAASGKQSLKFVDAPGLR